MSIFDAEKIIAVVKWNGQFRWFKSDREHWILDLNKWSKAFVDAGYRVPESDPSERFGILVLNEMTVDKFLAEMRPFEISRDDLATQLADRFAGAGSYWDVIDLFPIIFVDFDRKHLCGFYHEGTPMERYFPDGWTSEFEDFLTLYSEKDFPRREKFWVQNGLDLLFELIERSRQVGNQ